MGNLKIEQVSSLNELAASVRAKLNSVAVMISLVGDRGQQVIAIDGMTLPDQFQDGVPLDYSICQHTMAMNFPLAIDDAVSHPLLRDNKAFPELGITSYVGAPIHDENKPVGAICAIELKQRRWMTEEVDLMVMAAGIADGLIEHPA